MTIKKRRTEDKNKTDRVISRLDPVESDQLERVVEETGKNKSDLVREGLRLIFEKYRR